jgi:predicted TIM-barrel fold metal-dependent hydrolase
VVAKWIRKLSDTVRAKWMHDNAARVLKLG